MVDSATLVECENSVTGSFSSFYLIGKLTNKTILFVTL